MKKIIALVLAICLCLSLVACGDDNALEVERITNPELLEDLENSDPEAYAEAKAELRKFVEDEVGDTPDKVDFYLINASSTGYAWLHAFYKVGKTWYGFSLNWQSLRIPTELDQELIKICLNG